MPGRHTRAAAGYRAEQSSLGLALLAGLGDGLPLRMVVAVVLATLAAQRLASRWSGFGVLARIGPYRFQRLIVLVGLRDGWLGWQDIRQDRDGYAVARTSEPPRTGPAPAC